MRPCGLLIKSREKNETGINMTQSIWLNQFTSELIIISTFGLVIWCYMIYGLVSHGVSSNCPHWFCDMRHIWARVKDSHKGFWNVFKCYLQEPLVSGLQWPQLWAANFDHLNIASGHAISGRVLRHCSHNTSNLHENRWRQGWLFWHASGSSAHLVQMKPIVYTNLSNNMTSQTATRT